MDSIFRDIDRLLMLHARFAPTKQSTRANALHDFKSRAVACRAPKPSQGLRNFTSTHQVRLQVVASHDEKRATRFRVARNHEGITPRRFHVERNQVGATRDPAEVRADTKISKHKYLPDLADGVRTRSVKVMRPPEPWDRTPMVFSWTANETHRTQDVCRILDPPPNFGR